MQQASMAKMTAPFLPVAEKDSGIKGNLDAAGYRILGAI